MVMKKYDTICGREVARWGDHCSLRFENPCVKSTFGPLRAIRNVNVCFAVPSVFKRWKSRKL